MLYKLTTIFISSLVMISCNDEDNAAKFTEQVSPIVDSELPITGELNKKISFIINHGVYNGCGQYSRHETVTNGKEIFVTVFAKYPVNAFCTYDTPVRSTSYDFTPTQTGEYVFHFRQDGENYLVDNLIVN